MAIYKINNEEIDFVGIGKMMIDTGAEAYNIPHLHFLVYRNYEHLEAICLELGLIASGPTQEEAAKRLVEHTNDHIKAVMNMGGGFREFKDVALNEFLGDYWAVYHHAEFGLAETKQDLSHNVESIMTKAVFEMLEKNFIFYIKSKARGLANEIISAFSEYKKNAPVKDFSLVSLKEDAA